MSDLMSDPVIRLDSVALCYRLAQQRLGSFKEYLIHMVKGSLTYEQLWALRGVDLIVTQGEMVGIIGPNGAGKSTLAKVITGVLKPTEGQREVRGTIAPILELTTGFDYELTGYENIFLNALLLGRRRVEIDERLESIIEFSGLGKFIHSPIRNYSSGMVARLGFSIATAWVPDVLILDEALAVGDARFLKRCQTRMSELREAGATTILISHATDMLRDYCTRCVWLDQGVVQADGPPGDVLDRYNEAMSQARTVPDQQASPDSAVVSLDG
ncbi:MAG: ABC transporter ATP-binding protein [Thermoanaerobaculia bacterium]|nr:ABC transporter ATP-binding protein [Thermoanaerobaculia bacterium]